MKTGTKKQGEREKDTDTDGQKGKKLTFHPQSKYIVEPELVFC